MPIAALAPKDCRDAANHILNLFLAGKSLSPLERYEYVKLANDLKNSVPEESLQMRALIAMIDGDEKNFYKLFSNAITASCNDTLVRANFASALSIYGDYEKAEEELRIVLNDPLSIVSKNCFNTCLYAADAIENEEIIEDLLEIAAKYEKKIPIVEEYALWRCTALLPEDSDQRINALNAMTDPICKSATSEKTIQDIQTLIEEIEADSHE